jgi:hypothetical protein
VLYLKDWHLANQHAGAGAGFYRTPDVFLEDWMNPRDGVCVADDHRFVYIGPQGSFTPLHADVMRCVLHASQRARARASEGLLQRPDRAPR